MTVLPLLGAQVDRPAGFIHNGVQLGGGAFHVFAGLCAVDTRAHLDATFAALQRAGVVTARAGAYKPRSSPYDFQGCGAAGLRDIFDSASAHGIKLIAIEVLHERHLDDIKEALRVTSSSASVLLQIGTRNTQNFELLRAVGRQQEFPVLLKRGMGITLDESLLAAEHIAYAGNTRVVFCLRGVRSHLAAPHRNLVDFAHVPTVKRLTCMPVCADPSHAVGARTSHHGLDDLHHASAQAVIAGADMLLVDVHPQPAQALCDGAQALTLEELPRFFSDVHAVRAAAVLRTHAAPVVSDLHAVRAHFDAIDAQLLALLAQRHAAARAAAHHKGALGLPITDLAREHAAARARAAIARALGLDDDVVQQIFAPIVAASKRAQADLLAAR